MSNAGNFESASATELVAAVTARKVSALELCNAAIARIERLDGEINAVVVRDFARAREQASACDAALARGVGGALMGVPMTVKESHNVAGLPTTWGLPPFREFRPASDGVLVSRLRNAGAIILGKTNVPPSLGDWQSSNPIYGRTLNPHDPTRTPGGSSGGAAAAVASGMVALELGSDIGGSIRVPAHFCGIFGHKPSYNLLPLRGHTFPGTDGASVDLAVAGPLARTAADLELAMSVLAGPDADEAVGYRLSLPEASVKTLKGCRVLMLDAHPCAAVDKQIRDALGKLADDLSRAGAHVERSSLLLPDLEALHASYMSMLLTIVTRGAPGEPKAISAHDWLTLMDKQAQARRQCHALFESFDVVMAPPFGTVAFEHTDEADWAKRKLIIDGVQTDYGDQLAWAGLATFAMLPSTAAPLSKVTGVSKGAAGLPIGVQIMGPYLGDRTTMAVAGLLGTL